MNKLMCVKQLSSPRPSGCILDLNTRNQRSEIFQEVKMNAEDQNADSQQQPKSRSESFCLSRCAGCYKQVGSVHWRGGDGESSSSAEDSGPEVDSDSETESSSSSCCSMRASPETPEEPETEEPPPACGDAAEPRCGGEDGDKQEETSENQADTSRTKEMTWRAPLIKSLSLPASFTPQLIPQSMLPRPHTVVSTLHLQVLSQKHNDDVSYILRRRLYEREDEKTGGRGGVNNLLHPWMGLPWQQGSQPALQQHQLSHQYQQHHQLQQQLQHQQLQHQHHRHQLLHPHQLQQPQCFPPLSAQGQRLTPPTHTLSGLHPLTHHTPLQISHPPQTHLHTPAPPTCWWCYSVTVPHSANCIGHLPR